MKIWSFAFLFALLTCGIISETSAAPLELITASEAAGPNLSIPKGGMSGEPSGLHGRSPMPGGPNLSIPKGGMSGEPSGFHGRSPMPGGPQIIVEKPEQGSSVPTPFPVRVRFIPSPGARINLQSLEIAVLKMIKISLLSRVKPYLNEKGINVPEAKVPPGTYNIEIAIADNQGRVGSTIQTWIVR